jgi:hypothetical protein
MKPLRCRSLSLSRIALPIGFGQGHGAGRVVMSSPLPHNEPMQRTRCGGLRPPVRAADGRRYADNVG